MPWLYHTLRMQRQKARERVRFTLALTLRLSLFPIWRQYHVTRARLERSTLDYHPEQNPIVILCRSEGSRCPAREILR